MRTLAALTIGMLACAPQGAQGAQGAQSGPDRGERAEPLGAAHELVLRSRVWSAPSGADGAPLYTLAWRRPDGSFEDVGLGHPVRSATAVADTIFAVDAHDRLLRVHATEGVDVIADQVLVAPTGDAQQLAFVRRDEGPSRLRAQLHLLRDDGQTALLDDELQSLGALAWAPDHQHLVGVGALPGGVAGLHVFDARTGARRCLTNCELRVGQPWHGFVPSPGSARAYRFEGEVVRWDAEGTAAEVRYR